MRTNIARIIEPLLITALLMPVGMLLGAERPQPAAVQSSAANWYDVEQAGTLLNHMQTLADKIRRQIEPVQVQELQLDWQFQAATLNQSRYEINTMGKDLRRLDATKKALEPWQQSLVHKITPNVREMVYQMDAAIKDLNAHQNRIVLSMTEYPQNINMVSRNAKQVAGTISTVTQYARAEGKMAAIERPTAKAAS